MDFLGINYYTRQIVRDPNEHEENWLETVKAIGEFTEMDWEVHPEGLYDILTRVHYDYHFPKLYITENGAAFPDEITQDGRVHDDRRTAYLQSHFQTAAKAIKHGVPLAGFYVWSLMDNFEWAYGYDRRFGIVYVDFDSLKRYLKDSALWYQKFLSEFKS